MALILAIEPDKKQASAVRALARGSLNAQMLVADSTAHGLHQLEGRVPDLILTSLLLSPKDESALDTHLRALDAEGHRVPTLVIPVLGPIGRRSKGGLLTRLKKPKKTTGTEGCDPETFAEQITEYLDRAAAERALDEEEDDDELPIAASAPPATIRPEKRAVLPEPDESAVEAVAGSVFGRISTFDRVTPKAPPAPGVVESAFAEVESAFVEVNPPVVPVERVFAQAEPAFTQVKPTLSEPVPDVVPQERILKDPFSIEGLAGPGGNRTKTAPEPIFEAAEAPFQFAAPPPEVLNPVPEVPLKIAKIAAAGDDEWDEITIETSDSLEITAEPIDLNAFVEELEGVVSSFAKPARSVRPVRIEAATKEIRPIADAVRAEQPAKAGQPIWLATRYTWPRLEGLPAGVDWEIAKPGDPDYQVLAGFMAAFEPSAAPGRKRSEGVPYMPALPTPPAMPAQVEPPPVLKSARREDWGSLTMRLRYSWPPLEGIECVDLLAEIEPDETGLYTSTDPEPPKPQPRPSLLRPERSVKAAPAPPVARPAPQVEPVVKAAERVEPAARPAARIQSAVKGATPIVPAAKTAAPAAPVAPAAKPSAPPPHITKTAPLVSAAKMAAPAAPAPRTAAPVVASPRTGARIESAVKPAATSRPPSLSVPPSPAPETRSGAPATSPGAPAPAAAPPAAQWLEILSAIRRDIQELRAEHRADAPTGAAPESNATAPSPSARSKGIPSATADDAVRVAKAKKPHPPVAAPPAKPARKRKRPLPPKQDEWGFFDPDQCGFAALLAKLEEIEGDEPVKP